MITTQAISPSKQTQTSQTSPSCVPQTTIPEKRPLLTFETTATFHRPLDTC
uniref:ORF4 n=1 Tax=Porcine adenovirus 5 TaxID=45370 RepID=Q9E8G2_9ADEN|nr:ORF4 [Porcine adenovirus 5]